jgi:hypothetical protein
VTWLEEVVAGLGAGIVAVVLVVLWLAPLCHNRFLAEALAHLERQTNLTLKVFRPTTSD